MKNKNLNLVIHEDYKTPDSDDVCKICTDTHRVDLAKKEYEKNYIGFLDVLEIKIDKTIKEVDFFIDRYRKMAKNSRTYGNDEYHSLYIGMVMAYEQIKHDLVMEKFFLSIDS